MLSLDNIQHIEQIASPRSGRLIHVAEYIACGSLSAMGCGGQQRANRETSIQAPFSAVLRVWWVTCRDAPKSQLCFTVMTET